MDLSVVDDLTNLFGGDPETMAPFFFMALLTGAIGLLVYLLFFYERVD